MKETISNTTSTRQKRMLWSPPAKLKITDIYVLTIYVLTGSNGRLNSSATCFTFIFFIILFILSILALFVPCSLTFQAYIILDYLRWPISNAASIIMKSVAPSPASRRWLGLRGTGAQWKAAFKKGWKKRLITEPSQCVIWKGARGWLPPNASFTLRIIQRKRKTKNSPKKSYCCCSLSICL